MDFAGSRKLLESISLRQCILRVLNHTNAVFCLARVLRELSTLIRSDVMLPVSFLLKLKASHHLHSTSIICILHLEFHLYG